MPAPGDTSEITIDIEAPTALVESTLMRISPRRRPATRMLTFVGLQHRTCPPRRLSGLACLQACGRGP